MSKSTIPMAPHGLDDASTLALVQPPTCGGCTHWRANPPDPGALGVRTGRCCEGPPSVVAIPGPPRQGLGGMVQVQVQIQAFYPPCLPGNEACDRYEPRQEG